MNERQPEPGIIGGLFGLPTVSDLHAGCIPPFFTDRSLLLVNARSGISYLVDLLSPAQVWVPSYLCASILQAIGSTARIQFYEVNDDLVIPSLHWLADVQSRDLVILIDYFGYPCDSLCVRQAQEQGAWVLEDACQALLSRGVGRFSDFVLYSPRKFLGVPDGGILAVNHEVDLENTAFGRPPTEWMLKALLAVVLRREFDQHGGTRRWFELFQEVERDHPIGNYAMSELSNMLLTNAFDYPAIAKRRVDNYRFLAEELGDIALFPDLPPGVVPLGFPIRVRNRDQIRQVLFEHKIYPPVHWPIEGIVPAEFSDSHRLSTEVMTLLCDQRYCRGDMARMAQLVLQEWRA
jgi:dTDP-4-amino-4,6-dideoxygalactose transaminase